MHRFLQWGLFIVLLASLQGCASVGMGRETIHGSDGAEVNAANKYGETALTRAAADGHVEIVRLLLADGADVNAANQYGETALTRAAADGHAEIVSLLLTSSESDPDF